MNKYDIELEIHKKSPAAIILEGIRPNSKVLEFGCGNGRMTRWMKEKLNCSVTIVEQDKELYQKALVYAEDGLCGNIEDKKWLDIFQIGSFDYVIFADILEHLYNPEEILRLSEKMINNAGTVWISVPNLAHNDILIKLYENDLEYTDTGIMDISHVHHFTYRSLENLIDRADFEVIYENCVSCPTGCSEQCLNDTPSINDFLRSLEQRPMGEIYQYVFQIAPKGRDIKRISYIDKNKDVLERRIFFDFGEGYTEENQKVFYARKSDFGLWIRTEVPVGTKILRFDPVLKKPCKIDNLSICSNKGILKVANSNGKWEGNSLIFSNLFPVLYVTDMDNVEWVSITGEITYSYNFFEKDSSMCLSEALDQIETVKEEKKELISEINAYREEQNHLNECMQAYEANKRESDERIQHLTDVLQNKEKQEGELRCYQNELLEECAKLRKLSEEKDRTINQKEIEYQKFLTQLREKENELLGVREHLEEERDFRRQIEEGREREVSYFKEQVLELKERLNNVNEQLKMKTEQVLFLENENKCLLDDVSNEKAELAEQLSKSEQEKKDLVDTIKVLEIEKREVSESLEKSLEEKENLKIQIVLKEQQNTGVSEQLNESQSENKTLVVQLENANNELMRLRNCMKILEAEKSDFLLQIKEISEVSQLRDDNIRHLQRVIQDKNNELASKQSFIAFLSRQIDEYRLSTSWRLTEPFRYFGRLLRREVPVVEQKLLTVADEKSVEEEVAATVLNEEEWNWDIERSEYLPLVTVIVPNYNHEPYLRERLDSIYNQTYKNFEVILLDDCSKDNSRQVLQEYADMYKENTTAIFNTQNCGRIFEQWNRGIEAANGELIWIAESDDYCEPNFLEKLVPLLARESVMLAFARSVFMTEGKETWNTEQYLADLKELSWNHPFTMTAHEIVRKGFSIKNIIPNVSSAVFRNTGKVDDKVKNLCSSMKLSGDWIFYLNVIRGGCISYTNETTNYYRIHVKSTSLKVQQNMDYYREYEAVSIFANQNYIIPDENFQIIKHNLKEHYKAIHHVALGDPVDEYYSVEKIVEKKATRTPNVAMVCFSLQPGGGEVYGIYLANEMKRLGIAVTLLDLKMGNTEQAIKDKLDKKVPLVSVKSMDHTYHILKQLGIEIIHTHHGSADVAIAGWLKNGLLPVKQVITLHGMYEMMSEDVFKKTVQSVYPVCKKYIYIADKNLEPFKNSGFYEKEKFTKLPNGLPEIPSDKVERGSLGVGKNDFVLVLASRGIEEKGWREAIEAVKMANRNGKRKIHLVILGDGDIREELEKNAPEYVHFMGIQNNVRGYFAMCDAGIVPTRFKGESYPLVIIECLQSGKPVIATDIAEVKNQLTDEWGNLAGILLKLEAWQLDTKQIACALTSLANDMNYYKKLKKRCKSAAKKFNMTDITKAYLEIYQTVLHDKE